MVPLQCNEISRARLRVSKYHALGNSYLVLDPRNTEGANYWLIKREDGSIRPSTDVVRWLCDSSRGIGSNGLLFGPTDILDSNTFGLCIINSDGTYSGFSGNGIRIFAKYLLDEAYTSPGASLVVQPLLDDGGNARTAVPVQTSRSENGCIDVTLPYPPRFGPGAIGAECNSISALPDGGKGLSFAVDALATVGAALTGVQEAWKNSTFVDVGNPHCTTFVQNSAHLPSRQQLRSCDDALRAISFRPDSKVDITPTFAHGANLQWIRVRNRSEIDLVVYERGEGPTDASGSSASAAACAAFARGLIGSNITVNMPGGSLAIRILADADKIRSVTLSGFATRILEAYVDIPLPDTRHLSEAKSMGPLSEPQCPPR